MRSRNESFGAKILSAACDLEHQNPRTASSGTRALKTGQPALYFERDPEQVFSAASLSSSAFCLCPVSACSGRCGRCGRCRMQSGQISPRGDRSHDTSHDTSHDQLPVLSQLDKPGLAHFCAQIQHQRQAPGYAVLTPDRGERLMRMTVVTGSKVDTLYSCFTA